MWLYTNAQYLLSAFQGLSIKTEDGNEIMGVLVFIVMEPTLKIKNHPSM